MQLIHIGWARILHFMRVVLIFWQDDDAVAKNFKHSVQGEPALFLPECQVKLMPPAQCTECVALDGGQTLKEVAQKKYIEEARRVIAVAKEKEGETRCHK